ncbi:MAG TPA: metallophosphoesterase [Candidatus Angelobacter sp.]
MNRQSLFHLFLLQLCGLIAFAQMPALSPLPKTGSLSQPPDPNIFTFVIAGDNRPANSSCPQPPIPGTIFADVHEMKPPAAFVLWTGDTISGKDPDRKVLKKQYKEFLAIAATAGVPVFNAPGNHEMDEKDEVPSSKMKERYRQYMAETYGAFNYGNSRFIALDSENEPPTGTLTKDMSTAEGATKHQPPGYITQKQLDLLKADLEANKDKAHIVIFMHHPVMPYGGDKSGLDPASVKALQELFAGDKKKKIPGYTNVSYVVSGHEHMYFNPQGDPNKFTDPPSRTDPSQPPYYLISGGGGAPLKKDTPGSFYHYLIFKVNGAQITPTLVKVKWSGPLCVSKTKTTSGE